MPDAFDILGLAPGYEIDAEAVGRAYLAAAAKVHPDLSAGLEGAAGNMAELNEARRILSDPEQRADLLLRRLGGPQAKEEKALPAGFLARMLSIREEIEEGLGEADAARREEHRRKWERWAREERDAAMREISGAFRGLPGEGPGRAEALRQVRVRLNAWRYVERLIEQLDPGFDRRRGM